jgi:peptide/nickel transport system substrate-binding protein
MLAASVVVASTLALSGCAGGSGSTSASSSGKASYSTTTVNTQLNTNPSTFDPNAGHAADDYTVARMLFDSLLRKDANNKIIGGIASSYKAVSPSDYTFKIRTDATCADGTKITPTIVKNSLEHFASPEVHSMFKALAFGNGTPTFTANDSTNSLELKLSEPWSEVPAGLTLAQSGIICPAGLADLDGLAKGTVKGAFSGPYTLTSAQPGVKYVMSLRDDYKAWPKFSKALPGVAPKTINWTLFKDTSTSANQLQSGDLDIANVADNNVTRFSSGGYEQTKTDWAGGYIVFNERESSGSPFADSNPDAKKLRTAVAQALDRKAYNEAASNGRATIYSSVASPKFACINKDQSLLKKQNKSAAKKTLSGVKIRFAGTTLMVGGVNYVAEALRAAGADVQLMAEDNATWATRTTRQEDTWDMTLMGDINAVGTAAASLTRVMGPDVLTGGRNIGGADNEEGVAELNKALSATTESEKCAAYQASQKAMLDRVDVVPLAAIPGNQIQRPGFSISEFSNYLDPATIRITK